MIGAKHEWRVTSHVGYYRWTLCNINNSFVYTLAQIHTIKFWYYYKIVLDCIIPFNHSLISENWMLMYQVEGSCVLVYFFLKSIKKKKKNSSVTTWGINVILICGNFNCIEICMMLLILTPLARASSSINYTCAIM